MATILDLRTVGDQTIYVVNADPGAGLGTPAVVGSLALLDASGVGHFYLKIGVADTAWSEIANNNSYINTGDYRRLAIYNTNASGTSVDDIITDNGFPIDILIVGQPTRATAIQYNVPNPGDGISSADFVLTEGNQSINGDKTFNDNVVVGGNLTVNGDLTYINTTNLNVADNFITLNQNGAANSGGGAGIGIEENNVTTGSITVSSDREGWVFKAPASNYYATFDYSLLTDNQTYQWPDYSGIVAVMAATGTPGQVTWINDSYQIQTENGSGADSLHWDATNNQLGIQTSTPSRPLDVNGSSIFRGALRIDNSEANYELFQTSVPTTDDTLTPIQSIVLDADSLYLIETRVLGKRTGGSAGTVGDAATYIRTFKAKNVGGVVTISHYDSMYTSEDQVAWDVKATIDVPNTAVVVNVLGAINNNIAWQATTIVQEQ